ncbi:(2Fe-2S)-binding protein [Variovorax sp. YR566]|uniref:(2Fe-2S)-binding protein n=1 Tax=Variovorax sp. YR566 TaxID=3450237 RepID=UPI003F81748F
MSTEVTIHVNDSAVRTEAGRPISAVLHFRDGAVFRRTPKHQAPRGLFCGMGVCFECLVTVDGRAATRACLTPAREGMRIETEQS